MKGVETIIKQWEERRKERSDELRKVSSKLTCSVTDEGGAEPEEIAQILQTQIEALKHKLRK
jgi:hypothetical protein